MAGSNMPNAKRPSPNEANTAIRETTATSQA